MSRKLNSPFRNLFPKSCACSSVIASLVFSNKAFRSPIPNNLPTKPSGLNSSKSLFVSPVPINLIGALVVAAAESAPPAFAVPSILVAIIPVMLHDSWNLFACVSAVCPKSAEIINNFSSGLICLFKEVISSTKSSDKASLPAVSINTMSYCVSLSFTLS